MDNKSLLLKALCGETTERAHWVPFVGVHGGALIGVDAEAYLKSADHMVAALKLAAERYQADGLPVVFDLQLEAEILGGELSWAKETPPSVSSHPLDEEYKIAALPEFSTDKGRLPLVLDAIRRCKAELGEDIALYGLLTGPLTLALHLRGDDVLLDMFDEEDEVPELLDYCAGIAKQMVDAYLEAGKSFGGNLQLTVVLLLGDSNDAKRDAVRCIDQASGSQGFVLAPGCDLPYAVKPENLEAVASLIRDPYQIDIARKLPPKDSSDRFDDIAIPNYAEEAAVIVDVVTLDSAGCAPCAYMVKAAQEAARVYDRPIEVREHKITGRDGLGYMTKLGCTAIPSICLDGKEAFASIIPDRKELVAQLEAAAAAKH